MNQHTSANGSPPKLVHVTTAAVTLNFLAGQVEHAKGEGFDVHAISAPDADLQEFAGRAGVEVHELPMARRITPLRDLLSVWRLRRILRKIRPDIVHGHTPKGGLLAMIAAWLCGVPVRIYHVHGLPMVTATGLKRWLLRWSEKVSCKLATQVLCVSGSVRAIVVAEGLCPADKIKVLLNGTIDGIDADGTFNPANVSGDARNEIRAIHAIPPDAPVVGFVGRIVRDKGIIELTQAWQALREEFPRLHLLLVGPFEPQDPLPPEVESMLRSDARVHMTGTIAKREVPRHYRAMDLLVLPTYREGFNTVILEAAAMELSVVASRVPGCVEGIIDGATGALVPPYDAAALAGAVRAYLNDPELRRLHGEAARARVLRDFRPEDMSEAICGEYARLLGKQEEPINDPARIQEDDSMNASETFYRRRGKRIFDIVVTATALLMLAPFFVLVAILVRLFLGAPILFRQVRTGRDRKPFTMLKFRTMTDSRDANGELLADSQRLTRFGKFLRGTSLDELPELWNILKGEMSLIGPRPLLPRYDAYYTERESLRFDVLPGLTGWAQINGRNDLAWQDRLECDAWYVEHCSFALDLKILFLTVLKVLRRDNVQVDPGLSVGYMDEERRQQAAVFPGGKA